MQINYYSIYDTVAEQASSLFPAENDQVAFRQYRIFLDNSPETARKDFVLKHVLIFDSNTCEVESINTQSADYTLYKMFNNGGK